jgi:Leucine-rich repeat (LRR) protein
LVELSKYIGENEIKKKIRINTLTFPEMSAPSPPDPTFQGLPSLVLLNILAWLRRISPETLIFSIPMVCQTLRKLCPHVRGSVPVSDDTVTNLMLYSCQLWFPRLEALGIEERIGPKVDLSGLQRLKGFPRVPPGTIEIKASYCDWKSLRFLKLPSTRIRLARVTRLDLSNNPLRQLPHALGNMTRLKVLRLYRCALSRLPESIGNLANLEELDVGQNRLGELPESIGNLTNLRILIVRDNRLTGLPESIGNLAKLKELKLGCDQGRCYGVTVGVEPNIGNQLREIPDWIERLPLRKLDLSFNPGLEDLPEWFLEWRETHSVGVGVIGTRLWEKHPELC